MKKAAIAGVFLSATLASGQAVFADGNKDVASVKKSKPDVTCHTYKKEERHIFDDDQSEKMRRAFALLVMALSKTGSLSVPQEKPADCRPAERKLPEKTKKTEAPAIKNKGITP